MKDLQEFIFLLCDQGLHLQTQSFLLLNVDFNLSQQHGLSLQLSWNWYLKVHLNRQFVFWVFSFHEVFWKSQNWALIFFTHFLRPFLTLPSKTWWWVKVVIRFYQERSQLIEAILNCLLLKLVIWFLYWMIVYWYFVELRIGFSSVVV